jgi:hypothetical protein
MVHSSEIHGDFYRLIKEGVYDLVVSAPDYMNDTIRSVTVTDYQATLLDIQMEKNPAAGLEPGTWLPGFRIYPNPATYSFMVEPENIPHGNLDLSVHTLDGRMVYHKKLPYRGSAMEISTNQMAPGIYLVRCTSGKLSQVQRVMVVRSENQRF